MCTLGLGIFDGPTRTSSIRAMKSWDINTVRIPLNEDCWLGINGVDRAYSGSVYRKAIEAYISRLNAAGLYVIIDVHWSASGEARSEHQQDMLDASHGYTLWRSLALTFKVDRAVLFDVYNEPHNLAATPKEEWRCWLNGCGEYVGMQGLVTTIRSTGARNVILLAGVNWASNESEWLQHEPYDPLHQLAATFHVYWEHTSCTGEPCWNRTLLPLASHVPVINDEFGEMQCGEATALTWLRHWMTYAAANGISMLAWSWDVKAGACKSPELITNYKGMPTPYGAAVREFYTTHDLSRQP